MNENLAKGRYREFYERQLAFIAAKDVEGLIRLMGGDEAFTSKLDSLFSASGSMGAKLQKSRQAVAQFFKTANPSLPGPIPRGYPIVSENTLACPSSQIDQKQFHRRI